MKIKMNKSQENIKRDLLILNKFIMIKKVIMYALN